MIAERGPDDNAPVSGAGIKCDLYRPDTHDRLKHKAKPAYHQNPWGAACAP